MCTYELTETEAAYRGPPWICIRWDPRAERRSGHMPPVTNPETISNRSPIANEILVSAKGVSLGKLFLRVDYMPSRRQPTENELIGICGASLSPVMSGLCLFLFFFKLIFFIFKFFLAHPTGPLCIYYGFQFCVFMGLLGAQMSASLFCFYALFWALFLLLASIVLFQCVYFCFLLLCLILS